MPANARATEGLQRCLEVMIEYELDLGNHDAAGPLVAELPRERPDLAARLVRLPLWLGLEEHEGRVIDRVLAEAAS